MPQDQSGITSGTGVSFFGHDASDAAPRAPEGVRYGVVNYISPNPQLIAFINNLNPIGFWMLDELGGTQALDLSGNARHGTYQGTYTQNQPSLYGNGQFRSSILASPTGGVRIADTAALNLTSAGTLIAWVDVEASTPSFGTAIGKVKFNGGFEHGYILFYQNTVGMGVQPSLNAYDSYVETQLQSGLIANDSGAHMIAATWNGTSAKVFYDGNVVASTGAWAPPGNAAGTDLMLGRDTGDVVDTFLEGTQQSSIIFNYALSETDIANIYSLTV